MPQSTQPLVSILIRSMDRPTLSRALDSAAAQMWPNLEIVVIAACGAEHRALPDKWRGRSLRLVLAGDGRKLPRPDAANVALDHARGEWFNFLDDDDELLPMHIATLLGAERAHGERVVYGSTRTLDARGRQLGFAGIAGNHVQLYLNNRSTTCATLYHRSLIDDGARFDPAFDVLEDQDFQINCATRTPFRFVDAPTSVWHAEAGQSGGGFGANTDQSRRFEALMRLRKKWDVPFRAWLNDVPAVLFAAQQYLKAGDLIAAGLLFDQVLYIRPDDVNALNLGGVTALRAGDIDKAAKLLDEAARKLPDHPGIRENLELLARAQRAKAT